MSNTGVVNAEVRTGSGSGAARRLRRQGLVPCVLQGLGGVPPKPLQVSGHELKMMLSRHIGENLLLDLVVDGQAPLKVLMKEVQHEPITGEIIHLNFMEVSMTEKMQSSVSVALVGIPTGVTEGGGRLYQPLRKIRIQCLPDKLPAEFTLDVSELKIGESLNVEDLLMEGITPLRELYRTIVTIRPPKGTVAEELGLEEEELEGEEAEGEEAAAEGEAAEEEASEE